MIIRRFLTFCWLPQNSHHLKNPAWCVQPSLPACIPDSMFVLLKSFNVDGQKLQPIWRAWVLHWHPCLKSLFRVTDIYVKPWWASVKMVCPLFWSSTTLMMADDNWCRTLGAALKAATVLIRGGLVSIEGQYLLESIYSFSLLVLLTEGTRSVSRSKWTLWIMSCKKLQMWVKIRTAGKWSPVLPVIHWGRLLSCFSFV